MASGLPPAPRWAWAVMIAGVLLLAVMLPFALNRGQVEVTGSVSDRTTEPTGSTPSPSEEPEGEPPVIAVYGDAYSAGGPQGGVGDAGWPALVADRLEAEVRLHALPGAGYVAGGDGETFVEQVEESPETDADVVVVFGSRNDTGAPTEQITDRATATYQAVRDASPEADLVVVGPAWSDEAVPAEVFLVRDAVSAAAESADATFVDPLTEGWFFGRLELIESDAINPTDEGHAYLASLIEPIVRAAVERAE